MDARISAVINTLDEEPRLAYALRSLAPWVDEIVVVDMHSNDRTAEIARAFGAQVYFHERLGFADPARAFAVEKSTCPWILVADADEMVPEPLSRALREIARNGAADAVRIPRLNYLLGSPLLHAGWGPEEDRHLRFFRRGMARLPERVHQAFEPAAGARVLDLAPDPGLALVHFNYLDVADFLERLNRYTTLEADPAAAQSGPGSELGAALQAGREFFFRYVRRAGFRDGWRGFYLSCFMAFYRLATSAKRRERTINGTRDQVTERYRMDAEKILSAYGSAAAPPLGA